MNISLESHIALRTENIREAEDYYCHLFDLRVAWRETETPEGWRRLPSGKTWEDAELAGIQLEMVMLHRDRLALEKVSSVHASGSLSHIGLLVDKKELNRLRGSISKFGCSLIHDSEGTLVFDDKFGVRWEPSLNDYSDPSKIGDRPERMLNI